MVTVYVPTPFRRATNNKDRVTVEADSVGEVKVSVPPSRM